MNTNNTVRFSETPESLELARKNKIDIQVNAILKRAQDANIPDRYMRINAQRFLALLDDKYHSDKKKTTYHVYREANDLLKTPFVFIDGGNTDSRKEAGFAILFRLIACDTFGGYYDCGSINNKFRDMKYDRNSLASELKNKDILFIGELSLQQFEIRFHSGKFIDDVLTYRYDNLKPTIISFAESVESVVGILDEEKNIRAGTVLPELLFKAKNIKHENNPTKSILRIRVKRMLDE